MVFMIVIVCLAFIGFGALVIILAKELQTSNDRNLKLQDKINKMFTDLSSLRVKHGMTFEKWVPFSKKFEEVVGPKENAHFLGCPIDFVAFYDDKIVFVEIKTGNSKPNHRQQIIRGLVKDKKVEWAEIRDADLDVKNNE